jgi:hypothetical protein
MSSIFQVAVSGNVFVNKNLTVIRPATIQATLTATPTGRLK